MSKSLPRKKKYDWSELKNTELQNLYTITVQNRFAELLAEDDCGSDDVTTQYENFILANNEAAEKLLPTRERKKSKVIASDPRIVSARKEVQKAFLKFQQNSDNENQLYLQNAKQCLQNVWGKLKNSITFH